MINPLVSVIVPCYNQAEFLPETLESVLNQSWQNWECIIVNDGSQDNSALIADEWCKKDIRFRLINQENRGVSSARNTGILSSKGDFILPLDSDDKISNNYIEGCVKVMLNEPETRIVYGNASFFGDKSGVWDLPKFDYELLLSRNIIYCTALYKKSSWLNCGGYDSQFVSGLEDWDFWLSIINEQDKIVKLDNIMFYYRIRQDSRNSLLLNKKEKVLKTQSDIYLKHIKKISKIIPSPIQLYVDYKNLEFDLSQYKNKWTLIKNRPLTFLIQSILSKVSKKKFKNEL